MCNDIFTIGKFTLHGYSLAIAAGFIIAMGLVYYFGKKFDRNMDIVLDIALISFIGGFVGAKILYIIVDFQAVMDNPKGAIFSGFVVYGGIILASILIFAYSKIKKFDFFEYMDFVVPFVAIVQGFGRIGCFLAGCCYGAATDSPLGVVFPEGSICPSGVKRWPTQLFSAVGDWIIAIAILVTLFVLQKKKLEEKYRGIGVTMYLFLYGVGRFLIEFLRSDPRGSVGSLSTSQFISIFVVLAAIALAVYVFMIPQTEVDKKKAAEMKAGEKKAKDIKKDEKKDADKNKDTKK